MKTWDLHTSAARIRQALKDLKATDARIVEEWQDDKAREIEENFIDPLDPLVRSLLMAISELDEVLAKAAKVCEADYQ